MKLFLANLLVMLSVWNPGDIYSQTLTEKLKKEDPFELVKQAREKGKIVRGAILFHQGNINCAKCHRSTSEQNRIGPNLSLMGDDVSDESIVESILEPSKVIKKGFETVAVLTLDGVVLNGLVVNKDENQIIIRDQQNVDLIHKLRQEDVDEIQPGRLSSMPDKLADQLKDRQQFLDLLRYVIDLKERGPVSMAAALTTKRKQLEPYLEGLVSIQQYNCGGCHDRANVLEPVVASRKSPRLNWSAKKLNPNYVMSFIKNPANNKPGSTMPNVLSHLDAEKVSRVAKAITQFLVNENGNEFQTNPPNMDAVRRGFRTFHSVGCVACHADRDEMANERKLGESTPLGPLHEKYSIDALVEFLEDPLLVRASGHMPNMQLTHREAMNVANFLLQQQTESLDQFEIDRKLVSQGKQYFEEYRCANCHSEVVAKPSNGDSMDVALLNVNTSKGCLSSEIGRWPRFNFTAGEHENIVAALEHDFAEVDNDQRIEVSLRAYNCLACHSRNDLGGVSDAKNPHFTTTNLNLGDQGRIPPSLTGVGAKLKSKWMRDVLVNRRSIRPYMNTRMPQYGEDNVGYLVELFQNTDRLSETQFAKFDDQKEMRKWGLELSGSNGLNCVACHTYKYKLSDTMPAVDLTEMAERLKKDWFHQYMLDPQKFSPNTVMPSFWPNGKAIRKDIKGNPADQVEALWQYLIDGRQAGTPRGVVREPLEIVVSNEAKMLRRQYPGIGKRGIGVGYPGGVNLAYDAEQMRLALIWKGKFVDPGGVWRGQGAGNVRPMGKTIEFAKGPDLDLSENPWEIDEGRPPQHQFRGYRLGDFQRPTFKYTIGDVSVEDHFQEITSDGSEARLRRIVEIQTGAEPRDLKFRVASGPFKIDETSANGCTIGKRLKVSFMYGPGFEVTRGDSKSEVTIPVKLGRDQFQKLILEYDWD